MGKINRTKSCPKVCLVAFILLKKAVYDVAQPLEICQEECVKSQGVKYSS